MAEPKQFELNAERVEAILAQGRECADSADASALLERARTGYELSPEEAARLWFSESDHESIYAAAREAQQRRALPLETFSPLYMTNTCDAECRMCGMRRDNDALVRQTAPSEQVEEQLRTLKKRGMNAVALLTGEYRAERRGWALEFVNRALRTTEELEFRHVLINIGSLEPDELDALLDGISRRDDGSVAPKITMCTFQETYSREYYGRFMGKSADNPRADYDRRLANFDRDRAAGIRVANPGVLIGLNPDLAFEMIALILHTRHLLEAGMEVYLSLPRLRLTAGEGRSPRGASDEEFIRLVSLLALTVPSGKLVLTTREPKEIQHKLVPICTVLSAGSASVTPYTETDAKFPLETSQFEVIDQRPFEEILAEHREAGDIVNFLSPR
ncbi:MAG: hypothetical protein P8R42_26815 [Candidatus Binatia bacterium]|nr:hypothetical protein [Candidatus Binatia bacterium]